MAQSHPRRTPESGAEAESIPDSDDTPDERRLERHLRERTADGEIYVKSKFIADDLDLSPSQIGGLLGRLQESSPGLEIEKWAYTNATTWRVVRRDGD